MKLLVAFKVYPDLDMLSPSDLIVQEDRGVDLHFLPFTLNCFDESSLELALRLRDKQNSEGEQVELSAISVGGEQTELTLQTLKALGYEHPIRVKADEDLLCFHPQWVAGTVARYVEEHPQDMLVFGNEAPLGNSGSIPQLVAAQTGFPLIASVVDILSVTKTTVTLQIANSQRILEQTVLFPCVLSVGNAVISKLRVPTLRDRLKCKGSTAVYYPLSCCEEDNSPQLVGLTLPNRGRKGTLYHQGGEPALEEVFQASLKERLESL